MTKVRISNRLQAIADMVDLNSYIIDIGCDHALLDIYLDKKGIIKKAIASDLRQSALSFAKKNILEYNSLNVDVRCGNGLEVLSKKDKIDTIIISGLGYKTIIDILNKDKLKNVNTIIIQSNNHTLEVRKYLSSIGYMIVNEKLAEDSNIIYQVAKYKKGLKKYSNKELFFGPILLKNKDYLFKKLVNNYINENNKIIKKLSYKQIYKKIKLKINNIKLKKEIWFIKN